MPGLGSETGSTRNFGEIPNIPEKYQAASRRGIHFIELRYPKPTESDKLVYGPLDVQAGEHWDTVHNRMQFNVKWLRENQAHIRFVPDDRGVAVAWMPDDKFWRNRIYLMDNPMLYASIFGYHTREGQYPGSVVREEIQCLSTVLKEEKKIYRVLMNKREVVFYRTLQEAEEFVNDQTEVRHKLDKLTGEVKATTNKNRFEIVEGTIVDYKDEIVDLIARENGRHEFGWTQSSEFMDEIKPRVHALIKERQDAKVGTATTDTKERIIEALRSLTTEEKRKLLGMVDEPGTPSSEHSGEAEEEQETGGPAPDAWKTRTRSEYNKMTKKELQDIFIARGGNPADMTMTRLIDELYGQDANSDGKPEGEGLVLLQPGKTSEEVIT